VIGPDDSAGSLYYKKLFALGVEVVLESVDLIAAGNAPRIVQDESKASYDPLLRDEHARIDWRRPASEVYNLIRGCDPQPGAHFDVGGRTVRCYDARRSERTDLAAGEVGDVGEQGLVVGAEGGALRIQRLRAGEQKLAAAAVAGELGLRPGLRL
jgi:methionyl-tRNA formyltransferase